MLLPSQLQVLAVIRAINAWSARLCLERFPLRVDDQHVDRSRPDVEHSKTHAAVYARPARPQPVVGPGQHRRIDQPTWASRPLPCLQHLPTRCALPRITSAKIIFASLPSERRDPLGGSSIGSPQVVPYLLRQSKNTASTSLFSDCSETRPLLYGPGWLHRHAHRANAGIRPSGLALPRLIISIRKRLSGVTVAITSRS